MPFYGHAYGTVVRISYLMAIIMINDEFYSFRLLRKRRKQAKIELGAPHGGMLLIVSTY